MASIRTASRRPTLDVRASGKASSRGRPQRSDMASTGSRRDVAFDDLVDRAIAAIRAAGDRPDAVFGAFAEVNSLVRAVTYHEGKLLEAGIAVLASENSALTVLPQAQLPIVPAALEVLKRNDWAVLEGLRLPSEVHYRETYAPDLLIIDHQRHAARILDVKRSLASLPERRLGALRQRMLAAALTAGDWLHINGRGTGVSSVDVAIVDGSGERSDRATGIFALDEVGDLIGVPDAGEAMLQLRAKFACRVQQEVKDACLRALDEGDRSGADGQCADDDRLPASLDDDMPDDDAQFLASGVKPMPPVRGPRIVVGFARGAAP